MLDIESLEKAFWTSLLDVCCCKTGVHIDLGETVTMYDWGCDMQRMGEGHFEWNDSSRRFEFVLEDGCCYCADDLNKALFEKHP
jgi:hypothetical protein